MMLVTHINITMPVVDPVQYINSRVYLVHYIVEAECGLKRKQPSLQKEMHKAILLPAVFSTCSIVDNEGFSSTTILLSHIID